MTLFKKDSIYKQRARNILGDLALLDPGLDPRDPGLDPFFEGDGDLDPDRFLVPGEGLRLFVPFFGGEAERSILPPFLLPLGEPEPKEISVL